MAFFLQEEFWPSSASDSDNEDRDPECMSLPIVVQYLFVFISFWQFAYNISNNAINALLRFMKFFVHCLGVAFNNEALTNTSNVIPIGLKTVHKILGVDNDLFVQYVSCSRCHSVYIALRQRLMDSMNLNAVVMLLILATHRCLLERDVMHCC